jgi:hypothetical protein
VLGLLTGVGVAIFNIVVDEYSGWTIWAASMLIISLYFLLVLPVWLFVGPLRWFSKAVATDKLLKAPEPTTPLYDNAELEAHDDDHH